MDVNCCQRMCHFGLSLPISLKPVGEIPSHLGHKPLGSATVRACPQILYYLGLAIVFIDEYNPSKIFKMGSNSFEVTDVPFEFATPSTVAKENTLCSTCRSQWNTTTVLVQRADYKRRPQHYPSRWYISKGGGTAACTCIEDSLLVLMKYSTSLTPLLQAVAITPLLFLAVLDYQLHGLTGTRREHLEYVCMGENKKIMLP